VGVCIPAAGSGVRMGGARKPFLPVHGEPVLLHSLRPFLGHPRVERIVVALAPEDAGDPPEWLIELAPRVALVPGGRTRSESVLAGLEALPGHLAIAIVHDAARPLVTAVIIDRCLEGVTEGVGTVAGWPAVDTLKEVDEGAGVMNTPDRTRYWQAQTPQAFPLAALIPAYRDAVASGLTATDDAAVFERAGGRVRMVEGDRWNLKVTVPADLPVAEALMGTVAAKLEDG